MNISCIENQSKTLTASTPPHYPTPTNWITRAKLPIKFIKVSYVGDIGAM